MKYKIKLSAIIATGLLASQANAHWMCVSPDDPRCSEIIDQLDTLAKPNYGKLFEADGNAEKAPGGFTPVLVNIDPLGAVGDVAWNVHVTSLNVRSLPSTTGSILGSLPNGTSVTGDYYVITETDEEWLEFEFTPGNNAWISVTGINRTHPTNLANITNFTNLPISEEIVNRWWGIPLSYEPTDLVTVPISYTDGRVAELRQDARDAAIALVDASRAAGEEVWVGSPYRSGPTQQSIYLGNVSSSGLNQRFSAPPGHSEHQLGVTVDWVDPDDGGFLRNTDSEYLWMAANAEDFGWRQTYTATNTDETGYIEEPWHWRYIGFPTTDVDAWVIYE